MARKDLLYPLREILLNLVSELVKVERHGTAHYTHAGREVNESETQAFECYRCGVGMPVPAPGTDSQRHRFRTSVALARVRLSFEHGLIRG